MRTVWVLLLTLAIGGGALPAQSSGPAGEDEATIRSLEEQGRLGVLKRDTLALKSVWSENFMVNAPANRIAPNRGVVFGLIASGMIHYASFESMIERVRVDRDIAIVMGAETVRPTGSAPLAGETVRRRFTHLWQKDEGRWRLIARHAHVIPTGESTGAAVRQVSGDSVR